MKTVSTFGLEARKSGQQTIEKSTEKSRERLECAWLSLAPPVCASLAASLPNLLLEP
jgi:hypothetical protein